MFQTISFFVAGQPKGQPRVKAFARKMGGTFVARVFTPGTAEEWKGQIAIASKAFVPECPFVCALKLRLVFILPRPKSHYRSGANSGMLKPEAPFLHTGKPDADNFAKAVMDAMTVLRFWQDDAQVAELQVRKTYGEVPGCLIEISEPQRSVNQDDL